MDCNDIIEEESSITKAPCSGKTELKIISNVEVPTEIFPDIEIHENDDIPIKKIDQKLNVSNNKKLKKKSIVVKAQECLSGQTQIISLKDTIIQQKSALIGEDLCSKENDAIVTNDNLSIKELDERKLLQKTESLEIHSGEFFFLIFKYFCIFAG